MYATTNQETGYSWTIPEVAMRIKSTPRATDPTPAVDRLQAGITPMGYMIIITNIE
jgi:hypothetical protein